ncbi:MAG: excinuclease ABC subunit UvrA [Deltaproteobacteria bacterium]|nr:excinuclease ABC subunit UvrA [Deltaproteobacteria bacterium]
MPDDLPPTNAPRASSTSGVLRLRGVRQNNLRGVDLDLPLGKLIAISGVSGSGKSSLAFDTLYAEGQRRYAECLSSYARQFLERMDKPAAESIEGIVPTVALEQGRRLKAARSTVATLTEISEYLRLVFAAGALPRCPHCGAEVRRARTPAIAAELLQRAPGQRAMVAFRLELGTLGAITAARASLRAAGYSRVLDEGKAVDIDSFEAERWLGRPVFLLQDRLRLDASDSDRLHEAIEAAMRRGGGNVELFVEGALAELPTVEVAAKALLRPAAEVAGFVHLRASAALRCDACQTEVPDPSPSLFSSSSPLGACPDCAGFGRAMAIDWDKVLPDPRLSLDDGAIKPWSTEKTVWERDQLEAFCRARTIPMDVPWSQLDDATREQLLAGWDGPGAPRFYGVREWFDWLETRTYKMHVRVLLARYRKYVPCPTCSGTRLRPEVLAWQLQGRDLPGWLSAPIDAVRGWLAELDIDPRQREAAERPLFELQRRIDLLAELGVGYLTLDRSGRSLSGGELQRVQLVSALASGLSQVLYVLDEPSVGLHPRDNARLLGILRRMQAGGNTVVMVEHDPALLQAADWLVDVGPAAGELGGQIVYAGPTAGASACADSLTGDYLAGRRRVDHDADVASFDAGDRTPKAVAKRARDLKRQRTQQANQSYWLQIVAPRAQNLRCEEVHLLRDALNVVCGVSGSGKSTLIEEVLHRNLLRAMGRETDDPGAVGALEGFDAFADVVMIEATPARGSSRANPATLLKAWDVVRQRLAAEPAAVARGLDAGSFSFNRPGGRCEVCQGAGFETIDMQFLSDVRMRCEACDGKRFGPAALEVRHRGCNVAELLEMTAAEFADRFADDERMSAPMRKMTELGLGYLRLGQPLGTLSGGEAQRLEIARHLLQKKTKRTLFLLDEPSTGLHLDDVRVLLDNLRALVDAGNTVVLIEHHLDLIAAADHLVELGPEGGPGGGQTLFQGAPFALWMLADVAPDRATPTGRWLLAHRKGEIAPAEPDLPAVVVDPGHVEIRGARVHNLRNVAIDLPRDRLVVVTGVSGSGKSSLAFDVVFAEGQRRFLDCLSPYARQYLPPTTRPDVDSLRGVPPTVAIAQRTTRGGARSTVGTLTELWAGLRLLYSRLGEIDGDGGEGTLQRLDADAIAEAALARLPDGPIWVLAPVIRARKGHHREALERLLAEAGGRGEVVYAHVDGALCPIEALPELRRYVAHDIDAVVARLPRRAGDDDALRTALAAAVRQAAARAEGSVRVRTAESEVLTFELGGDDAPARRGVDLDPMLFSFTSARGWCPNCRGSGQDEGDAAAKAAKRAQKARSKGGNELEPEEEALLRAGDEDESRALSTCPACQGARLRPEALAVRLCGKRIDALAQCTPGGLIAELEAMPWARWQRPVVEPVLEELRGRVHFLERVGLDYLSLDRPAVTLSGGESQRIRLAAQLSSNLCGVLYVLDEPTIGLHPADNAKLIRAFRDLVERGNGLLVVEHDEETIRAADVVVELGPAGGEGGGRVLHVGPLSQVLADPDSPTGAMLHDPDARRSRHAARSVEDTTRFGVRGATLHNLRGVDAEFIRGRMNVVCGVSGSGKSSLVRDLLVGVGGAAVNEGVATDEVEVPFGAQSIVGLGEFGRVVEVDQKPIGRTPRSCPATYIGVWDHIRRIFAALPEAKVQGLSAGRFSFNTAGGRCETCAGAGDQKVELSFLPTVWVPCDACGGRRYDPPTLRPKLRGASIADVLEMSLEEAAQHFAATRKVAGPLELAVRMGLGYLRMGQGSNTLSGGEAQRLKLVAELATRRRKETLYVLDEPSTGLHLADQRKLHDVLHDLVERGDTLVVIEHNMDLVREADWVVECGPGGGHRGGQVIWQGPVAGLVAAGTTPTAQALGAA